MQRDQEMAKVGGQAVQGFLSTRELGGRERCVCVCTEAMPLART